MKNLSLNEQLRNFYVYIKGDGKKISAYQALNWSKQARIILVQQYFLLGV
jgi:hypothetical protein